MRSTLRICRIQYVFTYILHFIPVYLYFHNTTDQLYIEFSEDLVNWRKLFLKTSRLSELLIDESRLFHSIAEDRKNVLRESMFKMEKRYNARTPCLIATAVLGTSSYK